MSRNPQRRLALGDATIEVLAREGARGTTFRAVDSQADLPPGTAKNYFADRTAHLRHAAEHLRNRLQPDNAATSAEPHEPTGRKALSRRMRAQFGHISEHRTAYLALLELRLEATRRPQIRDALTTIVRDELTQRVTEHGHSSLPGDATDTVLLYLGMSGLIVEHLTLPDVLHPQDPDELLGELATRLLATTESTRDEQQSEHQPDS